MNSEAERFEDQRLTTRFKLEESGILYDTNFDRLPVRLIDVSTRGLKIAGVDLIADQSVIIEWNDKEIEATVVWAIGESAGLRFLEELDFNHPLLSIAHS